MRHLLSWIFATCVALSPVHATGRGTVVGYVAAFKGLDREMAQPRLNEYTHLVVAFANPTPAGTVIGTGALACAPAGNGGMISDAQLPFFDLIGIMSYDEVGPTWGTPGGEHSTYAQAQSDLAMWIGKGVPAEKLALGVPFYGRGFGTYREGWSLQDIAANFGNAQLRADVVGQRCGGCSYISYNGLPTLEQKAELAGAWGAGLMVWEVGQDLADGGAARAIAGAYRRGRSHAAKARGSK